MKLNINDISHYGDVLAIPFFGLLILYFYKIEERNIMENILLFFSISGFVLDILYSIIFFSRSKKHI